MHVISGGTISVQDGNVYMKGCYVEFDYKTNDIAFLLKKLFPDIDFKRGEHTFTDNIFVYKEFGVEENE